MPLPKPPKSILLEEIIAEAIASHPEFVRVEIIAMLVVAVQLTAHKALELATQNALMCITKGEITAYGVVYNFYPPREQPTKVVIHPQSIMDIEKLFA